MTEKNCLICEKDFDSLDISKNETFGIVKIVGVRKTRYYICYSCLKNFKVNLSEVEE